MQYLPVVTAFLKSQWLGVLGILLALVVYTLQRRTKRPWFATRSSVIAADGKATPKGLEVSFNGKKLDRICLTKVIFWNSGNIAIRASDIPAKSPLRISVAKNAEILDAEILQTNNANSGVRSVLADRLAEVTFEYLAPQNGFVLNIVHTGKSGADIKVSADFIDSKKLRRVPLLETSFMRLTPFKPPFGNVRLLRNIVILSFLIAGALPIVVVYLKHQNNPDILPLALAGGLYWVFAVIMYYFRAPPGLDAYFR